MSRDPYRDWSYSDRLAAGRDGDKEGCRRYDEDFDSSERAYQNYRDGNDFIDPEPDQRFS
jgi:hypothetical protein